jgi:hypothetical protein
MAPLFVFMAMPHRLAIPEGTVYGVLGVRRAERGIKVRNTIRGNEGRHAPMYTYTFRQIFSPSERI